jgi:DNA-binding XRE family transcriptional regulator
MNKIKFESLKDYKEHHQMTGSQLAEYLNIDRQWLFQLMWGRAIPSSRLAIKIHNKCNIPLEKILFPSLVEENKNEN